MTYRAFGMEVPEHIIESLQRYIDHGVPTGGFLRAVIENDLYLSVSMADEINIRIIPAILAYLVNNAPTGCWGRTGIFDKWLEFKHEDRVRWHQERQVIQ
jgi:hypothetical protein